MPHFHVDKEIPFETVCIDYYGPVSIKEGQDMEKAYILLITSATTRMTHLELAPGLLTQSLIRYLYDA